MAKGRKVSEYAAMGFDEIGQALGISGNQARLIYIGAIKKLIRRKRNFHRVRETVAFREHECRRKGVWEQWRDWA